jgi:hypothetical protein
MHNAKVESIMTAEQAKIAIRSALILAIVSFILSVYSIIAALPLRNLGEPAKLVVIILPLAATG